MGPPSRSLVEMFFHGLRHLYPGVPPRLPDRHPRRRELRIGERTYRNGDKPGHRREPVEDRRAAVGAEREDALLALVRDADVLVEAAFDAHVLLGEARLDAERAPGA